MSKMLTEFGICYWGFPGGSVSKASAYNAGDPGSIPGSGRSPGEGNGNPLQYTCLENPMDPHGVAKSRTRLSDFPFPIQQYYGIVKVRKDHSKTSVHLLMVVH